MPQLTVGRTRLWVETAGEGPETVLFAHGLLMHSGMFAAQMAALAGRYRVAAFDFRGQGRSEVTAAGYDMDTLTEDAAEVIAALDLAPCHFVGLSMGGFVGLRLALRRPELLRSLTLLGSSAEPEARENVGAYRTMALVARWLGTRPLVSRVRRILFGPTFLNDPARASERAYWDGHLGRLSRRGTYRAAMGVITRVGLAGELGRIRTPTLIAVGAEDVATVPAKSRAMHAAIPGSRLEIIPGAGHSTSIEQPGVMTGLLQEFLAGNG